MSEDYSSSEDFSSDDDESRDTQDEEQTSPDEAEAPSVLQVYHGLSSRNVDLVGDYAGNELFLIDGDSLLLQCFSDPHLDFHEGFQIAHAIYLVENFLQNLQQRKCNFHIAFFDTNKHLCVPIGTTKVNLPKYLLSRATIIRHLQQHMHESASKLHSFESIVSSDFQQYLSSTGLYFIMCHDGAAPPHHRHDAPQSEQRQQREQQRQIKSSYRNMILNFINRGYNVALVNGLEWRDTKVMTMVLEGKRRTTRYNGASSMSTLGSSSEQVITSAMRSIINALSEHCQLSQQSFTERELLAIAVISSISMQCEKAPQPQEELQQAIVIFLLHLAVLKELPIASRRIGQTDTSSSMTMFLSQFGREAETLLSTSEWAGVMRKISPVCDVHDLLDGRLLAAIEASTGAGIKTLPENVQTNFRALMEVVSKVSNSTISSNLPTANTNINATEASPISETEDIEDHAVLPFSNPVFDKHLESIRLAIDQDAGSDQSTSSARIFRELSHWHNAKRPVNPKAAPTAASEKENKWALKRNQFFMAEMQKYAASLTNAVGKSLEPETIVNGSTRSATPALSSAHSSTTSLSENIKTAKGKAGPAESKKKGGKAAGKNASKVAMLESIAVVNAQKQAKDGAKIVDAWHVICRNISSEKDLSTRHRLLKDYLASLSDERSKILAAEVELYMLSTLLENWIQICKADDSRDQDVAASIWYAVRKVLTSSGLTKTIHAMVSLTLTTLALPPVDADEPAYDRELGFKFSLPTRANVSLSISTTSPKDFQLLHCGPFLDRDIDSAPDARVDFKPDGWQRDVLDGIDANKSLFVVAPTSTGKTFIAYHAMGKALKEDDEGVVVYVAPTKALVNQIAAEIQARYSKKFKYGGKSVWAIHTRDYRINNPTGCQVLVTVPHVLQIMLLAPSHANSWSGRVKRIIFDEVHSIGNAEDGVVWEQLLLLAPCPIIALSATVGNPSEFYDWLSNTQAAMGFEMVMGGTTQRFSDLRKFNYIPPARLAFQSLGDRASFNKLGLDGAAGFAFIHPVASLVNKSRGMPDDLTLEPRDCLTLWQSMSKHQTKSHTIPDDLDPRKALPQLIGRKNIIFWEQGLKEILKEWMADDTSPFDTVREELGGTFHDQKAQTVQVSPAQQATEVKPKPIDPNDLLHTTLPLLCSLHEQDALPAILFNYDRGLCERISQSVITQLQEAETAWKETSTKWKNKVKALEEYKKNKTKFAAQNAKAAKASSKTKGDREDTEGDRTSKLDQQRDAGAVEYSELESFDPNNPVDGFSFADKKRLMPSELEEFTWQLRRRGKIAEWLIAGLERGIGVHHAGMNRKYRQVVEILFRRGFLRVVIATGTLALGINMPCKTVVFSGDSVFLTALNFRQGAGRAGRRGFDLLGNVVFQNISDSKICRLVSSRLPDLNGHFPVTTTLVLRLFSLLHESKNSQYAVKAINSLLSQPRLYMGGPAFKDQTLHHLRFSIEYLRRQRLLDSKGATLNFAGLVSHLYYTGNASFAFHALLKEGYFHRLCANIDKQERSTIEELMLVMSHLFGRVYCRQSDEEYKKSVVKPSSSIVFLPRLPKDASKILTQHATDTLHVFETYVETFVDQHVQIVDDTLPLTKIRVGAVTAETKKPDSDSNSDKDSQDLADDWDADEETTPTEPGLNMPALEKLILPPTKLRSHFVALSGHSDTFTTISDLCRTIRSGVFLEESVIPHVGSYPEELDSPLNAYLLDFFKHGDVATLERANRVRKGDVWFLLNDFSMVLATVITSLMNFMKLKPSSDLDMLEVMGDADIFEEAEDDKLAAATEPDTAGTSAAEVLEAAPEKLVVSKKKNKNLDSWEDAADEEEKKAVKSRAKAAAAEANAADDMDAAAWEGEIGERGLLQVLKAFQLLQRQFNEKFKIMWA